MKRPILYARVLDTCALTTRNKKKKASVSGSSTHQQCPHVDCQILEQSRTFRLWWRPRGASRPLCGRAQLQLLFTLRCGPKNSASVDRRGLKSPSGGRQTRAEKEGRKIVFLSRVVQAAQRRILSHSLTMLVVTESTGWAEVSPLITQDELHPPHTRDNKILARLNNAATASGRAQLTSSSSVIAAAISFWTCSKHL